MEIKELIQAGKLAEARQRLVAAVKASPADSASRTLLFQVLCYSGEWEKADSHLEAIAVQDSERGAGALGYRAIVHAEMARRDAINKNQNGSLFPIRLIISTFFCKSEKSLVKKKRVKLESC